MKQLDVSDSWHRNMSSRNQIPICIDEVIKQHRSQLYPKLAKMSISETMRAPLPSSSMIGMTKPYSDMYTQNHFTDLEQ